MKRVSICVTGLALALTSGFAAAALGALGTACSPSNSSNVPIGNADNYQTPFNTNLVVSAAQGMLANDLVCSQVSSTVVLASTAIGAPQFVVESVVTPPSNGVLITGPTFDGHFQYNPNPGFVGFDTFTYMIDDKNQVVPAVVGPVTPKFTAGPITVTIQVQGLPVAPTLSQWGLIALLVLLGGVAAAGLRRRTAA